MTRHPDRACPIVLTAAISFGAGFAVAVLILMVHWFWWGVRGHR